MLDALNRAVLDESRPGQFLTAIFARLTPRPGGGFRFTAACGGHPPPVVVDAAGVPRELPCAGTLLGVIDEPHIADTEVDLLPGDTLLLYTDGLTEASAPAAHADAPRKWPLCWRKCAARPPRRPPRARSPARCRRAAERCATTSQYWLYR